MAEIKIVIDGIPGATGVYILDTDDPFTNRELHTIKQISGVRLGEFDDALGSADNDLLVAFASVALKRSGKDVPVDALWDAKAGTIRFDVPKVEDDAADPPAVRLPDSPESESERQPSSGPTSTETGDHPVTVLRATGTQG